MKTTTHRIAPIALSLLVGLTIVALTASCRLRSGPPTPTPVSQTTSGYPFTFTDDLGRTVTFDGPPQKIVSLAPDLTEVLFALGLGDRVVGDTTFCDYPPAAKTKPKVGGYSDFSQEKIVALNPDLVLAAHGNPGSLLDSLRMVGVPVVGFNPLTYNDAVQRIEVIGRMCGVEERAKAVADEMRAAREGIESRTRDLPADQRPVVLCLVWLEPPSVAGPGSFLDDMLSICGARNGAAEVRRPWAEMSPEAIVTAAPEVLIITSNGQAPRTVPQVLRQLRANPAWRSVPAVKSGRVLVIDDDLVTLPGPRLAEGLRQMAAGIHPELFSGTAAQRGGETHGQ